VTGAVGDNGTAHTAVKRRTNPTRPPQRRAAEGLRVCPPTLAEVPGRLAHELPLAGKELPALSRSIRRKARRIEERAQAAAEEIRTAIRAGTFGAPPPPKPMTESNQLPISPTFETVGSMFVRASRDGAKVSWQDDSSMVSSS
jgi:hypothetical protein